MKTKQRGGAFKFDKLEFFVLVKIEFKQIHRHSKHVNCVI